MAHGQVDAELSMNFSECFRIERLADLTLPAQCYNYMSGFMIYRTQGEFDLMSTEILKNLVTTLD